MGCRHAGLQTCSIVHVITAISSLTKFSLPIIFMSLPSQSSSTNLSLYPMPLIIFLAVSQFHYPNTSLTPSSSPPLMSLRILWRFMAGDQSGKARWTGKTRWEADEADEETGALSSKRQEYTHILLLYTQDILTSVWGALCHEIAMYTNPHRHVWGLHYTSVWLCSLVGSWVAFFVCPFLHVLQI